MLMVGQKFPEMTLSAVLGDGTIDKEFKLGGETKGKTVVFFYPSDFTFVCPTELVAFDKALAEFESRGVTVIGVSVDGVHSHAAWRRTPLNEGGIGEVKYALVSDRKHELCDALGILSPDGNAYRASYLLDSTGMVRHLVINDMPIGRSVTEMLRVVDALVFNEEHGDVCPANWQKGDEAISTSRESVSAYLGKRAAA